MKITKLNMVSDAVCSDSILFSGV